MGAPHVVVNPADRRDGRVMLRDVVAHHVLTVLRTGVAATIRSEVHLRGARAGAAPDRQARMTTMVQGSGPRR